MTATYAIAALVCAVAGALAYVMATLGTEGRVFVAVVVCGVGLAIGRIEEVVSA